MGNWKKFKMTNKNDKQDNTMFGIVIFAVFVFILIMSFVMVDILNEEKELDKICQQRGYNEMTEKQSTSKIINDTIYRRKIECDNTRILTVDHIEYCTETDKWDNCIDTDWKWQYVED